MTVLDSCVVMDLADPDRQYHAQSVSAVAKRLAIGRLFAPDIVFAEVSSGYLSSAHARAIFDDLKIEVVHLSDDALYLAAIRYRSFKSSKESNPISSANESLKSILPDFYVGALAESEGIPLLTRDAKRKWDKKFPRLKVIYP